MMSDPAQHATAPARDASMDTMLLAMGEIKTQLAVISEQLKAVPDHENRIRVLETARAKAYGAAVASGILSSSVGGIIIWALSRH